MQSSKYPNILLGLGLLDLFSTRFNNNNHLQTTDRMDDLVQEHVKQGTTRNEREREGDPAGKAGRKQKDEIQSPLGGLRQKVTHGHLRNKNVANKGVTNPVPIKKKCLLSRLV